MDGIKLLGYISKRSLKVLLDLANDSIDNSFEHTKQTLLDTGMPIEIFTIKISVTKTKNGI